MSRPRCSAVRRPRGRSCTTRVCRSGCSFSARSIAMPRCSKWRTGWHATRSTAPIWSAQPERLRLPQIAELRRHDILVLADALGQPDRLYELAHAVERALGDCRVVERQVAFD